MFVQKSCCNRQGIYLLIFLGILLTTFLTSTSLMAGVVKFNIDAGLGNPKRLVIEYHRDYKFEDSISRSSLEGCLPDYGSVQEMKNFEYAIRVVYNVYKECGENVTVKNLIKYGLLGGVIATSAAVSAVTAVPAPPVSIAAASVSAAFTPFALGEVQSDTAKCVLKAFIESSDMINKDSGKKLIDGYYLLKDWSSYFESMGKTVPELMAGKSMKDFKSIAEFISATPERTGENLDRVSIVQSTANSINNLFIGSTRIAINKTNDAFLDCDIKKARNFQELSVKAAKIECKTYGVQYRMMEDSIEKAINRNYRHFSNITGRIPADDELDLLNTKQINAYNGLLRFSKVFEELEQLKEKINERSKNLVLISMNYSRQLQSLKNKATAAETCKGFGSLEEYLKPFSTECKKVILSVFSLEKDTKQLLEHINDTARQLSSSRWNDLNQISASLSSCLDLNQTEKRLVKLQSTLKKNPIYMYMDSRCQLVNQRSFNKEFNAVKKRFEEKKRECTNKNFNSKPHMPSYSAGCPKQNPGDRLNYKFDTNNDIKDGNFINCEYFEDGALKYQAPFVNWVWNGNVLKAMKKPPHKLYELKTYKNDILNGINKYWSYDSKTGHYYKYREEIYIDGKERRLTKWHSNENYMLKMTYDSKGHPLFSCNYNEKGNCTDCWDHPWGPTKDCSDSGKLAF